MYGANPAHNRTKPRDPDSDLFGPGNYDMNQNSNFSCNFCGLTWSLTIFRKWKHNLFDEVYGAIYLCLCYIKQMHSTSSFLGTLHSLFLFFLFLSFFPLSFFFFFPENENIIVLYRKPRQQKSYWQIIVHWTPRIEYFLRPVLLVIYEKMFNFSDQKIKYFLAQYLKFIDTELKKSLRSKIGCQEILKIKHKYFIFSFKNCTSFCI